MIPLCFEFKWHPKDVDALTVEQFYGFVYALDDKRRAEAEERAKWLTR